MPDIAIRRGCGIESRGVDRTSRVGPKLLLGRTDRWRIRSGFGLELGEVGLLILGGRDYHCYFFRRPLIMMMMQSLMQSVKPVEESLFDC